MSLNIVIFGLIKTESNNFFHQYSDLKKVNKLFGEDYSQKTTHQIWQDRFNNWKVNLFKEEKTSITNQDTQLKNLINQSNFEAWNNYKITPYSGDLYLFRAQEQRFFITDKKILGWKPFIKGKIHILDVPGDHLSLFNPPNGKTFAIILQELLNNIY